MKLIDKSALVTEIEKRRNEYINSLMTEQVHTLSDILEYIDTLEVKEVDLEKEIANQYESNYEDYLTYEEFADIAKHFFELGMQVSNKAQKEK